MAIIISEDNGDTKKIDETQFGLEGRLQEYVKDNPDIVPIYEINEDAKLFVGAREFNTNSGPIDALGIDQDGNVYVIETKLYKNADKRTVLAQALDYGASLWKHSGDASSLLIALDEAIQNQFNTSLDGKLTEFFEVEDAEYIKTALATNVANGNIKFVILMDRVDDRLKDLVTYVNQNSKFDIYAVDLEYYKHDKFEIIIPKLYGSEVKKEIVSSKSATDNRRKWDEQSYFDQLKNTVDDNTQRAIRKIYDWSAENSDKIVWGTGAARGSFNPRFNHISSRSPLTVYSDGSVQVNYGWLRENSEDTEAPRLLRETLKRHISVPKVTDINDDQLYSVWQAIPAAYAKDHIDEIIQAFTEFITHEYFASQLSTS